MPEKITPEDYFKFLVPSQIASEKGIECRDMVYFLTKLGLSIDTISRAVRAYWGVTSE